MSHTPGPWAWVYDGSSDYSIGPVEDPQGLRVAHVWDRKNDRAIANSNLIAAAPDLLAACKAFVAADEGPIYTDRERAAITLMREAIAKAEGR